MAASILASMVKGWAPDAKVEDLHLPSGPHAQLIALAGADFSRYHNLKRVDNDTVAYVTGNAVRFHSECALSCCPC